MSISNLLTDNKKPSQNLKINSLDVDTTILTDTISANTLIVDEVFPNINDHISFNSETRTMGRIKQFEVFFPTTNGANVLSSFFSTISSTIINTTTETSLLTNDSYIGTPIMPPNTLQVGSGFEMDALGTFSTSGGNKNAIVRLKINGVTLLTSNIIIDNISGTTAVYQIKLFFVIRSVGSTGTVICNGQWTGTDTTRVQKGWDIYGLVNIDTTIINALDLTFEWVDAATLSNDLSNIRNIY